MYTTAIYTKDRQGSVSLDLRASWCQPIVTTLSCLSSYVLSLNFGSSVSPLSKYLIYMSPSARSIADSDPCNNRYETEGGT